MSSLARHLLVELRGCPPSVLADQSSLLNALSASAEAMQSPTVVEPIVIDADGSLTGIVVTREAHVTVRTWPAHGIAAADVMANPALQISGCIDRLLGVMLPSRHLALELGRGILDAQDFSSVGP